MLSPGSCLAEAMFKANERLYQENVDLLREVSIPPTINTEASLAWCGVVALAPLCWAELTLVSHACVVAIAALQNDSLIHQLPKPAGSSRGTP